MSSLQEVCIPMWEGFIDYERVKLYMVSVTRQQLPLERVYLGWFSSEILQVRRVVVMRRKLKAWKRSTWHGSLAAEQRHERLSH